MPLSRFDQLLERLSVAVLQQVAGLLPAEDVVRRHAPWGAGVLPLSHQKLEEERRHVEAPVGFAVRENGAEEPPRAGASQKMLLVRRLVVRVAGREHDALDAEV